MKRHILSISILMAVMLLVSACSGSNPAPSASLTSSPEAASSPAASETPAAEQKHIIVEVIDSKNLSGNMIGEDTKKQVYVYLPPSYYSDESKRYPVIYNLHGYGDGPYFIGQKAALDSAMSAEGAAEYIIVEPNGTNKLGGSFYANSPATGNWEDYIVNELVATIDSKYRTLADKESRGIAGFSMGGFGALYLGFRHPDVYSAVLALSPGVWDENGINDALSVWDRGIRTSYGAAFSPDTSLSSPYATIPAFDGSDADNKIIENWKNGFGNWPQKVKEYKELNIGLKAVTLVYGTFDGYKFILNGVPYLSKLLTDNGIENELITFKGGHSYPTDYATERLLPFFTKNLKTAQ